MPEIERRIGLLHLRRGEWELAEASLAAASDGLEPVGRSLATADRALAAHRLGDEERALGLATSALSLAGEVDDAGAIAQAHNILGMLAGSRGDPAEAVKHLELGATIARAAGDRGAEAAALNNLALAVRASGDSDRAIELTTAALDLCVVQGDRHREAALRNNLADLLPRHGTSGRGDGRAEARCGPLCRDRRGGSPGAGDLEADRLVDPSLRPIYLRSRQSAPSTIPYCAW